jgi:hypothetical protein
MLGAIVGDIAGSRFEWNNIKMDVFRQSKALRQFGQRSGHAGERLRLRGKNDGRSEN